MITRPEDVTTTNVGDELYTWDGTSLDPGSQNNVPNKETSMDWAEHQRIVFNARNLLIGEISINPSDVKKAFRELQSAFSESTSRTEVRVSKGIHQPLTNPHLQLRTVTTFRSPERNTEVVHKFHLDVSAIDVSEIENRFQWVGVRFSYLHKGQKYCWPIAAPPVQMKRERRSSISAASLAAFIHQKNEAEARAAELAEKTAQANAFSKTCADFEKKHGVKIRKGEAFQNGRPGYAKLAGNIELRFRYNAATGAIDLL